MTPVFSSGANSGNVAGDIPFQIDWQIKIGTGAFAAIGSTKHTVYVTAGDPLSTANTLRAETLFNLGCRRGNLIALDIADRIPEAIWAEFSDRLVQRVIPSSGILDARAMTYYGGGGGGSSCENLLSTGNGICGAWSKFLIDCFRAQGIDAEWMLIHPKAPPDADLEAALSAAHGGTWAGDAGPEKFLYVREWNTTNVFGPLPETGIQGQGNEDPPAKFSDHAFVRYASMLYDPSYGGQTYSSLMAWENASLKAIGARYTATGSGGTSAAGEWIWKNNIPTAEETTMTLSAYPIAP